jgi:predicted nucleotidyltransferase
VPSDETFALVAAMKTAAGALRNADVPFVLAGGLACWSRGGPQTDHDVDFFIKPEDVDRALAALEEAGMRTERPPEGWLVKAWDEHGALIDLIYSPSSGIVTDELIERAEEREVMAVRMKVATLEDVMVSKLLALKEQEPDFASVLEIARMLREQMHWEEIRERTTQSPFAKAFFTLVEELGIVDRAPA